MMVGRMIICGLLFSLSAAGQQPDSISNSPRQETNRSFMELLHRAQHYLDSAARAKVDPHFIEVPDKPWRVILRYKKTAVNVDYSNGLVDPEKPQNHLDLDMNFSPSASASIGIWVGYRGTGLSYSYSLAKNKGRYFSFTTNGAKYGVNFRYRRFNTDEASASIILIRDGIEEMNMESSGHMLAPVWIRSAYLNGYYVFNGRRYSQAAAYTQSVIQRRSAGSFLVGATWYQSSFENSDTKNTMMLILSDNVNRISLHQANIGVGYGFNLVPFRGLVINAMAMPTISVYNRVKVDRYYCNYSLDDGTGMTDDYGAWNHDTHTWANGKTEKPLGLEEDTDWYKEIDLWGGYSDTSYGKVQLNVDLRLGIAYNWKNYFIGLQAQFNQFFYSKDNCEVSLIDGYARLSLGVRL